MAAVAAAAAVEAAIVAAVATAISVAVAVAANNNNNGWMDGWTDERRTLIGGESKLYIIHTEEIFNINIFIASIEEVIIKF